jgi:hypothetical protein
LLLSRAGTQGSGAAAAVQQSADSWDTLARAIPADLDAQPEGLDGVRLHGYQMRGLRWLLGLHDLGLSGILADDMGAPLAELLPGSDALRCTLVMPQTRNACGLRPLISQPTLQRAHAP